MVKAMPGKSNFAFQAKTTRALHILAESRVFKSSIKSSTKSLEDASSVQSPPKAEVVKARQTIFRDSQRDSFDGQAEAIKTLIQFNSILGVVVIQTESIGPIYQYSTFQPASEPIVSRFHRDLFLCLLLFHLGLHHLRVSRRRHSCRRYHSCRSYRQKVRAAWVRRLLVHLPDDHG